jgi:hypothetical protein
VIWMEQRAAVFTSAANARTTVMLPVASADTALPKTFPWLVAVSSGIVRGTLPLGDEFAIFADEAREWADLTFAAGLESWPDDWPDQPDQ